MLQDLELGIPTRQTELDLSEADDIRLNDVGPMMRASRVFPARSRWDAAELAGLRIEPGCILRRGLTPGIRKNW